MDLRIRAAATFVCASVACTSLAVHADEGGVSFWVPGQYGSFAAIAPSPGWSLPLVFYDYGGSKGAERVLPNGQVSGNLSGSFDGLFVVPTYTLGTTILGAVPSFSMAFIPAYSAASANWPRPPVRVPLRLGVGRQRPLSYRAALLEQGQRQQLHDLPGRRHPGRQL